VADEEAAAAAAAAADDPEGNSLSRVVRWDRSSDSWKQSWILIRPIKNSQNI
jgi:hypothetical protein